MTTAVVFAYSEVGVRCLRVLLRHDVRVQLVLSHKDDPAESRWYESVAETARAARVEVAMPDDPNSESWVKRIAELQPDFLFSFYYRHMLCDEILATARRGALNMHGSLLPKYRGRAPVNWAIIHGETETGASLHYMHSKPDSGPLVGQQSVPIRINDTALEVSLSVAAAAERLLERCLPDLMAGRAPTIAQDLTRGSYFGRRRPEDGRIEWDWPALKIHNLIRAVAPPFPGAFGTCGALMLRLLGSRYCGELTLFPHSAPCLYAHESRLQLDCVDGRRLTLTSVELDGEALTPTQLESRYGKISLSLPSLERTWKKIS